MALFGGRGYPLFTFQMFMQINKLTFSSKKQTYQPHDQQAYRQHHRGTYQLARSRPRGTRHNPQVHYWDDKVKLSLRAVPYDDYHDG